MALHRVREGYVVFLENGRILTPGTRFEPSREVLENQGWKIEPVKEAEPVPEKSKPETRDVETPPQDRMVKKPPVKK
ncbi:MAG: hypothetical protein ACYC6G_17255 [Desulfobaccales bacterium]